MKHRYILCALLAALTSGLGAQNGSGNDGTDWAKSLLSRIKVNGYAQAGYTYRHQDGKETNTLDVKRTLFWAKADITDRWSFLFMTDFSSEVQEFYTDYRITRDRSLTVRFGQFKNGLSLENPLSPTKQELIDVYSQGVTWLTGCGSDPLFGVQYGRDLGVEIYGYLFSDRLYYELAVMNGQGINKKDKNNKKDVIVRLDYRPTANWRIVATGQLGTGNAVKASAYNPDIAVGEDYKRNRWTLGGEWKSHPQGVDYWKNRCTTLRGEIMAGRDGDVNSWGGYVTASVPVCEWLDAVGSADYFKFNDHLNIGQMNFVAGVQHWFYRTCRVQLQYTWANPVGMAQVSQSTKHYGCLQAQVQVAF